MNQNSLQSLEPRTLLSTSTFYNQTNLVSDNSLPGTRTDANLINGWGIAHSDTGPWWVSSAEEGLSIAYDGAGAQAAPNVIIPPAAGGTTAAPTGVAANGSRAFKISSGGNTAPSVYVFVTEDGTISGWNPAVDETHAILKVDNSRSGAVYKGGAIGVRDDAQFFFAADFHNGRIDVFNSKFSPVAHKRHAFADTTLPAGYAPFNITNINNQLYVTYALQDSGAHDDVAGPRHGFIDVFNTDGALVKRFASRGALDSHWGTIQAPHNFGKFSDDILVGNFGNGKISAFNHRGRFMGFLTAADGNPVEIPGLWGIAFGNGATAGPSNTLFFAAGPSEESHGLFGSLTIGKSHHHHASSSSTSGSGGTGGGINY
jgi:uncharacterized protein (TIGR03118 family)